MPSCGSCHDSTDPVSWNGYGAAVLTALEGRSFEATLGEALRAVEDQDSDGDGVSNLDELLVGTSPGRAESLWTAPPPPETGNTWYALGEGDPAFALRRLSVLYCGHSPSYAELEALAELDAAAQREQLHDALAACLDGPYWRGDGLARMADKRIRPIVALGPDTDTYFGPVQGVLADYRWDFRLWRYVLSDDRDMRELLTARYHVVEDADGRLERVEGVIEPDLAIGPGIFSGGQPVAPEHRAGMLTTKWFLATNTMFSALPRTTAAQAYRAYLGMDISKHEGIMPVAGEPLDIDQKGVAAPACAQCHSTLDPLAYAFADYNGLGVGAPANNGAWNPERPSSMIPGWDEATIEAVIFGEPVTGAVGWATVAAESAQFRRAMAEMLFTHALGRAPGPAEFEELIELADSMVGDGYSANRLIHRIVDTTAFGAP